VDRLLHRVEHLEVLQIIRGHAPSASLLIPVGDDDVFDVAQPVDVAKFWRDFLKLHRVFSYHSPV
jgi:hypothetical protein